MKIKSLLTKLLLPISLVLLVFLYFNGFSPKGEQLEVQNKIGESGSHYTLFYKNDLKISFETTRPNKLDESILVCIPAAFTNLTDYSIDGLYIRNGVVGNKGKINTTIGGAIKIINGHCSIFPTNKGKLINDSLIHAICLAKGSFFQQIQMIRMGLVEKFKDKALFQRRGIAIFKDGKTAIIESDEAITLATFANDLAKVGVQDLLYTDMGAWDEGWYRESNIKLKTLGKSLTQTNRQSNWIIFKK